MPARSPPVPARSPPVLARCRLPSGFGSVPAGAGPGPARSLPDQARSRAGSVTASACSVPAPFPPVVPARCRFCELLSQPVPAFWNANTVCCLYLLRHECKLGHRRCRLDACSVHTGAGSLEYTVCCLYLYAVCISSSRWGRRRPAQTPQVPARFPLVQARSWLGSCRSSAPSGAGLAPTGVGSIPVHFLIIQIKYLRLPSDQSALTPQNSDCIQAMPPFHYLGPYVCIYARSPCSFPKESTGTPYRLDEFRRRPWICSIE